MSSDVKGQVLKLTGDFMPGSGESDLSRNSRNSTKPHKNIFVIALKAPVPENEFNNNSTTLESIQHHSKFIKMTETKSMGEYTLDLPPGLKVTIVIWLNNALYLNLYEFVHIQIEWHSLTVPQSDYSTFNIKDTKDAVS
ncbi:unnamed protein product [Adineta steineri]|uniref:Uncharacterized protein n=1 Tax=Adineta steineri TaxID=433720 RepID=A0A814XAF5_9BILA|nr:unnamed protein product [Adineta steineri]CAF1213738.1 unnamed protein product [Adineta steineri]CAF3772001.1 unnamed protein product [Adineta steineri]CAF4155963.1 unnamed protein product [Adineta steineri]